MSDTVAALSSGLVPSGVAVIRVSGPQVRFAIESIAGKLPEPRVASLRVLRAPRSRSVLDQALVLYFPAPASFTGEDVAEFHCHGGRAVVDAVLDVLWSLEGLSPAQAGDFTRQAFANGKLDLTQVEAVGDLIHAASSAQRMQALDQLSGSAGDILMRWRADLVDARALIEADLDFSDEDDVPGSVIDSLPQRLETLAGVMDAELANTVSERLREGFRVVLAGAPNSGKSTLLNALLARDAALVSPIAGTTRDQLDVPIDLDGLPVILTDTAGLRDAGSTADSIEVMGIERSRGAMDQADCIVWLEGGDDDGTLSPNKHQRLIRVRSKSDLQETVKGHYLLAVSGVTGDGLDALKLQIAAHLKDRFALGNDQDRFSGSVALDVRRRMALQASRDAVGNAIGHLADGADHLDRAAEELRLAQRSLGAITGDVDAEGILDALFSRFCIGK